MRLKNILCVFCALLLLLSFIGCEKAEVDEKVIDNVQIFPYSKDQLDIISPKAYNVELAKKKKIISHSISENKYLKLQAAYMALLNYYLESYCDLNNYQKMMDDHVLSFVLNKDQENSVYKYFGGFGRKNIYIRSNVYIEYLSEEDLALLQSNISFGGKLRITDELIEMLKRTYADVIAVRYDNSGVKFDAVYEDRISSPLIAPNTALVFELCYGKEYDAAGNLKSAEDEKQKRIISGYIKDIMEDEIKNKLGLDVKVFIRH